MTKMTIADRINAMDFGTLTADQFDFLKERALKSIRPAAKGPRKPTKRQAENEVFKTQIVAILADSDGLTATQVGEHFGWDGSQKAAALLHQLMKDGEVVQDKSGKAILFKVA